jgi:hypothetical protein
MHGFFNRACEWSNEHDYLAEPDLLVIDCKGEESCSNKLIP